MRKTTNAILLVLIFFGSNACFAFDGNTVQQDTTVIVPDGKFVQGNRLRPYHLVFNSYAVANGQESKTGSVDDSYQFVQVNHKKYALRVAKISLPGREILDSGLVDIATLKPVYHRSHQTSKIMLLNFDGQKVNGTIESNQKKDNVDAEYPYPLFDSYYENLIARTIELKDGFLFKFPDYIYEEGGLVWQSGKVEKVQNPEFGKDGWTISYVDSKSGRKTTYWLDKDRNIMLLRYEFGDRIFLQRPDNR